MMKKKLYSLEGLHAKEVSFTMQRRCTFIVQSINHNTKGILYYLLGVYYVEKNSFTFVRPYCLIKKRLGCS
jgi:hypothetical protein